MTIGSTSVPRALAAVLVLGLATPIAHAAEAPIPAGVLSSYAGLAPAHTIQTEALWRGEPQALATARTARIATVAIAPGAGDKITAEQRGLIANELARTLCARLSGHYRWSRRAVGRI